jgi:hypothetical protein
MFAGDATKETSQPEKPRSLLDGYKRLEGSFTNSIDTPGGAVATKPGTSFVEISC